LSEVREVAELAFKPEDFAGKVQPDDAQLRKFYDDQPASFQMPETATVQYVVLDADALASRISIAEADVAAFYEQNRKRYSVPEERRARHILLRMTPDAPKADRDAALARAADLLARLKKGAKFEDLARTESQDPGSARQGGDFGLRRRRFYRGKGRVDRPGGNRVWVASHRSHRYPSFKGAQPGRGSRGNPH
jgi:peptidyl-prolyl cis-trans isomerase D